MTVEERRPTLTVNVKNIPRTVIAQEVFTFFESLLGKGEIFAVEIFTEHKNWKSRGHGRVQFDHPETKIEVLSLSQQRRLFFRGYHLSLSSSFEDIIVRPLEPKHRIENGKGLVLHAGIMVNSEQMGILETWDGVSLWIMPEKKKLEFFVQYEGERYKLEVGFGDVIESQSCFLGGDKQNVCAILVKLKHAPKIFKKVAGPNVASRFSTDRYHICKENFDFLWVRTTDFSSVKAIGNLSCFCWEIKEDILRSNLYSCLPFFQQDVIELILEKYDEFQSTSNLVPAVINNSDFVMDYEVIFQLNSLVHTQKLSLAAVDNNLFQMLSTLDLDTALCILQKMHRLQSTCYEPLSYIGNQCLSVKKPLTQISKRLMNQNMMNCHRVLVTPSKIFCLGPELENSNYIVKHFAYGSDFIRVTFVDEDWGRLSANTISTNISQGIFGQPHRTDVYHRTLSVLRDGIVIGDKKFQFLAFSASQLRSNSVWMFASNDHVKAEEIRDWMGCFNKIRSVSKCAARMGQLFSASKQTLEVHPWDVDLIPDIEVDTDGVKYCFSDGIGKISYHFANEISRKLGLLHVPSAFQIRYGGYKGVIAVDRQCFQKLALRSSMLKFESNNRMLNVTKWSESMPCYLNREVITLFSTLGVKDDVFLAMQDKHLQFLGNMMTSNEAALCVLESTGGGDIKAILRKMLLQGYEPKKEPFLFMMLQSHLDNQLSDLRSRCRIFVPKGRILVGCLDETGILEYGQVYIRIVLTKSELECRDQPFFHQVDETTSVVKGKVVVTKNPCLHPGDVRVLEAMWDVKFEDNGLVDCLVFPQKGERPHTNECSGGDLDGDQYFISWDENLIPPRTVTPMDYTGRRARIMDHDVTIEEIQSFFVEYLLGDTLGAISTAHLVHADREADKAMNKKCVNLASLHSMSVDFAKTGAPAEMPRFLKLREFPDFMERWERPMYESKGALGHLYRATIRFSLTKSSCHSLHQNLADSYDCDLIVDGYKAFLEIAQNHKQSYLEKMDALMKYYGATSEVEILTGNLCNKSHHLQRDNRRYGEVKDRILVSVKNLAREVKGWFESSCNDVVEQQKLASAWYHVTYHQSYSDSSTHCIGFPITIIGVMDDELWIYH